MRNKLYYCSIYCIIVLLLFSCASPVEQEIRTNSFIITNYLLKARYFLLFVIFLLDSGKEYWINLYSRLYYFYFTLARVKSIIQQNKILENSHQEIWNLSSVKPRKTFGEEFKKIRARCDYNIIENEEIFIRNTNDNILKNHRNVFIEQINDIKKYYPRKVDDTDNEKIDKLLSEIINEYDRFLVLLEKTNEKLKEI